MTYKCTYVEIRYSNGKVLKNPFFFFFINVIVYNN